MPWQRKGNAEAASKEHGYAPLRTRFFSPGFVPMPGGMV